MTIDPVTQRRIRQRGDRIEILPRAANDAGQAARHRMRLRDWIALAVAFPFCVAAALLTVIAVVCAAVGGSLINLDGEA